MLSMKYFFSLLVWFYKKKNCFKMHNNRLDPNKAVNLQLDENK